MRYSLVMQRAQGSASQFDNATLNAFLLKEAIGWRITAGRRAGCGFMAPQLLDYEQFGIPRTLLSLEQCDELLSVPGIDVGWLATSICRFLFGCRPSGLH